MLKRKRTFARQCPTGRVLVFAHDRRLFAHRRDRFTRLRLLAKFMLPWSFSEEALEHRPGAGDHPVECRPDRKLDRLNFNVAPAPQLRPAPHGKLFRFPPDRLVPASKAHLVRRDRKHAKASRVTPSNTLRMRSIVSMIYQRDVARRFVRSSARWWSSHRGPLRFRRFACGARTRLGGSCRSPGGTRQETVSHARRRGRVGRAKRTKNALEHGVFKKEANRRAETSSGLDW
jgi:hypothetical protein